MECSVSPSLKKRKSRKPKNNNYWEGHEKIGILEKGMTLKNFYKKR